MPSEGGEFASGGDPSKGDAKKRERPHLQDYQTATRLSAIAVIISIIALIAAIFVPGPIPSMAKNSIGGPVTIGPTCTHYPGAEVSITVTGAGTVVVSATVGVGINHTAGISDEARIVVSTSTTDCAINDYTAFVSVPFSLPTDPFHYTTVPILHSFSVSGSGTVTFYVNGVMALGADSGDRFDSASLVAVHYPR